MHLFALPKELDHEILEPDKLALLVGPQVRMALLALAADLEALLEVGCLLADLVDLVRRRQQAHLLTTGSRVAPVSLGCRPAMLHLGLEWNAEELCRLVKGRRHILGRDRYVLQVDEARRLEAVQNGVGGFLALARVAAGELGEVDELRRLVSTGCRVPMSCCESYTYGDRQALGLDSSSGRHGVLSVTLIDGFENFGLLDERPSSWFQNRLDCTLQLESREQSPFSVSCEM